MAAVQVKPSTDLKNVLFIFGQGVFQLIEKGSTCENSTVRVLQNCAMQSGSQLSLSDTLGLLFFRGLLPCVSIANNKKGSLPRSKLLDDARSLTGKWRDHMGSSIPFPHCISHPRHFRPSVFAWKLARIFVTFSWWLRLGTKHHGALGTQWIESFHQNDAMAAQQTSEL